MPVVSIETSAIHNSVPKDNQARTNEGALSVSFSTKNSDGTQKYVVLSANELYPFSDANDAMLFQALALLGKCVSILESAQHVDPLSDYIGFDELMIQTRATLRDLFALRSIGDGFASLVNALIWSLKNNDTGTLSRKQLSAVLESLKELKRKPLLHFDTATALIDQLEEADLTVDPAILDELITLA